MLKPYIEAARTLAVVLVTKKTAKYRQTSQQLFGVSALDGKNHNRKTILTSYKHLNTLQHSAPSLPL